jgi:S1-C subfamily serine protease
MVVLRDENRVAMQAQMMDLANSLLDPTEMEVNGSISARSTGFQNVIQHDTVLAPNDCGGPVIDVDGNCVGMNIARAGRICSYALPSKVVASTIQEMLESVSQPTSTAIAEVDAALPGEAARRAVSTTAAKLPAPAIEVQTLKPAVPAAGRERK